MNRRTLLAAAPLILTVATRAVAAEPRPGRTYYDRLALDTPDAAAATFVTAYAAGDYATVWMVLALNTQRAIETAVDTLALDQLLAAPAGDNVDMLREAVPALDTWEESDTGWLFDHIMQLGARRGVLPITLGTGATLKPASGKPPSVEVADPSGPVTLQLTRSAAGRWRVLSAMPPSRNPARPPWGLPLAG